jgi:hypothetical protein
MMDAVVATWLISYNKNILRQKKDEKKRSPACECSVGFLFDSTGFARPWFSTA